MMDCYNNRSTGTTKVNALPEKEVSFRKGKYEVGHFSLLISLFLRLLADYLLFISEIPQIIDFKAVLSTTIQLQV